MKSVPHDVPVFIIMFWHGGQEQKYKVHLISSHHLHQWRAVKFRTGTDISPPREIRGRHCSVPEHLSSLGYAVSTGDGHRRFDG
jgi:hypothetical protein